MFFQEDGYGYNIMYIYILCLKPPPRFFSFKVLLSNFFFRSRERAHVPHALRSGAWPEAKVSKSTVKRSRVFTEATIF